MSSRPATARLASTETLGEEDYGSSKCVSPRSVSSNNTNSDSSSAAPAPPAPDRLVCALPVEPLRDKHGGSDGVNPRLSSCSGSSPSLPDLRRTDNLFLPTAEEGDDNLQSTAIIPAAQHSAFSDSSKETTGGKGAAATTTLQEEDVLENNEKQKSQQPPPPPVQKVPSYSRGADAKVFQRSCSTDHCCRVPHLRQGPPRAHHHRRQQSCDYILSIQQRQQLYSPPPTVPPCHHHHPHPRVTASLSCGPHPPPPYYAAAAQVRKKFSDPEAGGQYCGGAVGESRKYSAVEVVTTEVRVLGGQRTHHQDPVTATVNPPDDSQEQYSNPHHRRVCTFSSGIGEASLYHALVVIFLEFFAWGLLTAPMIYVLNETFPNYTFLMNGLIMGIKGILSFLSAPLIGALSDVWGRKFFLLITVFFTCLPIPFMKINTWWYFALISMSGVFAVTYSIVFAYVADVTDEEERSYAYGLVSATFAASLVTSPALGAYLGHIYGDDLVVGLATAIAMLDVFFILVAVPESLPEKLRFNSGWSAAHITWENADPFTALWRISSDRKILLISMTVLLSYLPEAGQYSCFFVYLTLVMGFNKSMVATFIAAVGILSVVAQTAVLALLMKKLSCKKVIIVGLVFEMLQLMWYGFGTQIWMMWAAGLLAAMSSITYPAISAYVSIYADVDQQGVVQGIVTGMRGLCSGLGPAMFGVIFYIFHVNLSEAHGEHGVLPGGHVPNITTVSRDMNLVPGPPFVFGALMVITALLVAAFIPEPSPNSVSASSKARRQSGTSSLDLAYERSHKKNDSLDNASLPLMDESGAL